MAAPKGNSNAKGGSGGWGVDMETRQLQAELRKAALRAGKEWLDTGKLKFPGTKELLLKLIPASVPRTIEGTGDAGEVVVKVVSYAARD